MKHKVLHVVREAEGGIAGHVRTLLQGLDSGRYRQMVVGPQDLIVRVEGTEAAALPIGDGVRLIPDLRAVVGLGRLLRREQPDLIHLHGYKAGLIGMTALGAVRGRRERRRTLLTAHNMPPAGDGWKALPTRAVLAQLAAFPDKVITVSEAVRRSVITLAPGSRTGVQNGRRDGRRGDRPDRLYDGLPERQSQRVETVYNGIDLGHFPPPDALRSRYREQVRRALGYDPSTPVVGTIARLIPSKGVDLLTRAAERMVAGGFRGAFVVVGDGPERARLEEEASKSLPEGRLRFLGFRRDVPQILSALDLFILPSTSEGQSVTAVEAMAAGLPIVAARTGGVPEVVTDGESGVLVSAGSAEAIARAAFELLNGEPVRRERMGAAGRRRAEERFSLERMLAHTERIYGELLGAQVGAG